MEKRLVNEWEAVTKDEEGEAHIHTLHKYVYDPESPDIDELTVRRAAPTIIKPTKRKRPARRDARTVVAGDAQIPFHDEQAVANFHDVVVQAQPDVVIINGDMLDLPTASTYAQRPEWVGGIQDSIDRYHDLLAQLRADVPDAHIVALEGNHDQRLTKYIQRNAAELLGLKRARAEQELAVLSLRYLVRMDDLEVESIEGYPNGAYWLEDNIKATHGTKVAKGGVNAAKYLADERESTIFGHTHRQELAFRTFAARLGSVTIAAASPGTLADINGTAPGYRHTMTQSGETIPHAEDWQQGALVIDHNERVHHIQPVRFTEDGYYLDGKHYR